KKEIGPENLCVSRFVEPGQVPRQNLTYLREPQHPDAGQQIHVPENPFKAFISLHSIQVIPLNSRVPCCTGALA
ncbi:hypothetical protein WG66_010533, partial [Moniliophthora roreri]